MTVTGWLDQLSGVLLVALIAMLAYILVKRMAWAMRRHETQGMFTEFVRERDEWREHTLVVRFRVPAGGQVAMRCDVQGPNGEVRTVWEAAELAGGDHTVELDTTDWPAGRHSYRLVTNHQVLERFVAIPD